MSILVQKPAVSKAVLALRAYLASAPQAELDARLARVKSLGLPSGPSVSELAARQAFALRTEPSCAHFMGAIAYLDVPVGEYGYAMAA